MTRAEISKLVYAATQTFIAPTREKTLIYLRAAKANGFKVEEEHTREMLDALKSDHPTHADAMSLCTVTFTDDSKPSMLYYGVHGEQDTMKSEFYHAVDMSKPLFKDQTDMIQYIHAGLSQLYWVIGKHGSRKMWDGDFLFVSGDKSTGETPVGKNWATKSVFKPMTGVSIGELRKSLEQHSLKMHSDDPESHTLADCVEVHRRCQHQSRTAMDKYVLGAIGKMKAGASSEDTAADEVADTVQEMVDQVEDDKESMIKTIVAKWQTGANRSWDGKHPEPPICFFVFKDGDSDNFCGDNCVPILAYDFFSNPDARNWCVPVAQRSPDGMGVKIPGVKDISLTPHEEAFVHNNFEAFAAHFKPTADSDRKALAAMYNEDTDGSESEKDMVETYYKNNKKRYETYHSVSRHSIATMIKNPEPTAIARACLDLHNYKRAYPNADTFLLETAINQCTRIEPKPKRRRFDRPQAGARRIAWTSDEENDE
eukprot:COSAG06_NODE_9699_length_1840_cov_178.944859_2_plen_483_part_01